MAFLSVYHNACYSFPKSSKRRSYKKKKAKPTKIQLNYIQSSLKYLEFLKLQMHHSDKAQYKQRFSQNI